MSRSQATQTFNTATDQNKSSFGNEQNSYTQAQTDAGDYQKTLAKYAAENPYTQGGESQTTTNQELTNTSDAAAQAAGEAMQGQAVRTGTNAAGSIAATEATTQANERALGGDEASATQQRIGNEAQYNESVLQGQGTAEGQEANLASQQGNLATGEQSNANGASEQNQSFMDQFGGAFAKGLGGVAAKGVGAVGA